MECYQATDWLRKFWRQSKDFQNVELLKDFELRESVMVSMCTYVVAHSRQKRFVSFAKSVDRLTDPVQSFYVGFGSFELLKPLPILLAEEFWQVFGYLEEKNGEPAGMKLPMPLGASEDQRFGVGG